MKFSWTKQPPTYCTQCGLETKSTKLCKSCNRTSQHPMLHCDGCGEDYPNSHLSYDNRFEGVFCERCATPYPEDLTERMEEYFK